MNAAKVLELMGELAIEAGIDPQDIVEHFSPKSAGVRIVDHVSGNQLRICRKGMLFGTSENMPFKVDAQGNLQARSKMFIIDHPTKPGMKLVHGCLEGPENGVYVRGTVVGVMPGTVIPLPDYFQALVGNNYTVHLTPTNLNIGYVRSKSVTGFQVGHLTSGLSETQSLSFEYLVIGQRQDAKFDIVQESPFS